MPSTRLTRHIAAPRSGVYRALLDAESLRTWMVPDGMSSEVHELDARAGGHIRVSLTYDAPGPAGKTTAHTDTWHGRYLELVPGERVVHTVEFETQDPAMQGEMTVTLSLADRDGGTELVAIHAGLPSGLSPADNELGWRLSLAKLARLVEDTVAVRDASPADIEPLAALWFDGWQEAHAAILPEELKRDRTPERFAERLAAALSDVRVAGAPGDPRGFHMLKGGELNQLYVSARARGAGVASALIADAERQLAARGFTTAWLDCAIGNLRAARFYEKSGWHRTGEVVSNLTTPEGVVSIRVWRYEKPLH